MQCSAASSPMTMAMVLDTARAPSGLRPSCHFAMLNDFTASMIDQIATTARIARLARVPNHPRCKLHRTDGLDLRNTRQKSQHQFAKPPQKVRRSNESYCLQKLSMRKRSSDAFLKAIRVVSVLFKQASLSAPGHDTRPVRSLSSECLRSLGLGSEPFQ